MEQHEAQRRLGIRKVPLVKTRVTLERAEQPLPKAEHWECSHFPFTPFPGVILSIFPMSHTYCVPQPWPSPPLFAHAQEAGLVPSV